jgi:hypothetical protein
MAARYERRKTMARAKVAFIFLAPDSDPSKHRAIISTPEALALTVVGVKDYDQAAEVARELVDQGVEAIELCGGFGNLGLARVSRAVGKKAAVGAVRFDIHPLLGCRSGDDLNRA